MRPPYLQAGQKVAIVAPAKSINQAEIKMAISIFETWGLEVVLGRHLFKTHHQFAGTDAERAQDFQEMLDNPEIRAIICARGGYGTTRIIDRLDFTAFLQKPKWIVGFSDVTVLHCHLHNFNVETIHGVMPLLFPKQTEISIESLRQALFGRPLKVSSVLSVLNKKGITKGLVVGGNLTLFANAIGTPSEIDTKDKILFLEEVNEYLYHIDRMMVQLKRANKLDGLAGLIIGQFSGVKDNDVFFGQTVYEIVNDLTKEFNYPVCYNFPIGHEKHNMTVICNREARLNVGEKQVELAFD
ncbi:LD-carboxypeptidase [marine bacterium AO1-C]|nr:LD-carboxypeptidase [marine bacterium AO1-C]